MVSAGAERYGDSDGRGPGFGSFSGLDLWLGAHIETKSKATDRSIRPTRVFCLGRYLVGVSAACVVVTGNSSPRKYLDLSFDPCFRSAAFISGMAS